MVDASGTLARAKAKVEVTRARYGAFDVAVRSFKRYSEDDGGTHAAALTYYFFFSIFPLVLAAAAILGYVTFGNKELRDDLIAEGVKTVPIIRDAFTPGGIRAIINNRGNIALTAAGLALYTGSGVVVALEHALNRFHGVRDEPNFVQKRLRSLVWLAILGIGLLVMIGVSVLAGFAERLFGEGTVLADVVGVATFVAGVVVNSAVFATAFRFLPSVKQGWRDVWVGALVAGAGFQILNVAGTAYLARGETARNDTFGTFAAAATLLAASFLIAQLVLRAAEVNLVLQERRRMRGSSLGAEQGGDMSDPTVTEDKTWAGNGRAATSEKSAGQLMKEVTEDLSTLVRKEIELAKQELGASIGEKVKGAAVFAVVGVLAFFALIFLLFAIRDGFDTFLWTWVADILTAVVLLAIGGGAAMFAKKKLATPIKTDLTKETIKEDVEWAKTLGKR